MRYRKLDGNITIYSIIGFLILYIGIDCVFPPVKGYLGTIDNIIKVLINAILIFIAVKNQKKCFERKVQYILLLIFVFYSTVVPYAAGSPVWANRYMELLFFLTAPLMVNYYINSGAEKTLKKFLVVILLFAAITFIKTGIELLQHPYIVRSIKSSGDYSSTLRSSGIGGYEFTYFTVIMGVVFFYCFCEFKKKRYLLFTAACVLFTLLSNYIIALMLIVVGCISALVLSKDKKLRIIGIILIVLIVFSSAMMNYFVDLINTLSPNGRISRLFSGGNDVFSTLRYTFIEDRLPTLLSSVRSIGSGYGLGVIFMPSDTALLELGQHSHILDTLAILGIPASLIYFYLIFRPLRTPVCIAIVYVLLLFFNNATNSIALAVYFMVPLIIEYAGEAAQKSEENREKREFRIGPLVIKRGRKKRLVLGNKKD